MNKIILFFCLLWFANADAQLLSGDLLESGRRIASSTDFTFKGSVEGVLIYELAVDREGKVTSVLYKGDRSTIKSTPIKLEAENFLKGLMFQPGTAYPKFQHVIVQLNYVKQ